MCLFCYCDRKHSGSHNEKQLELANEAIKTARKIWTCSFTHNTTLPYAGWMNDPNGLIYHQGQYHAFINIIHLVIWGPMHWGHATSTDMVHWEHQAIALAPSEDYDRDGCFSGSAISYDNKLYLFYTGHIWLANQVMIVKLSNHNVLQSVKMVFISKGVVLSAPDGYMHFRDPKVWRQGGKWWMVVGKRLPRSRTNTFI